MNWDKKTLGEIYEIEGGSVQTGPFGSQLHESDYKEFGIPVIMPKDIVDDRLDLSGIAYISEDDAKRLSQHIVRKFDIVCPRRGEIGKRIIIEDENVGAFCGTGCIRLRGTGFILNQFFLFNFLKQARVVKWIENQAIGATMMNLNTSILKSIPIKYPPLPTQRKIAAILSAYDELIENNKQRIRLLEEMAEEIYKEWFVRMRFPGYETAKFVDGFPEGWENAKLESVCDFQMGQSPLSEFYNDEGKGLPFHQGVTNFNSRFPDHIMYCTDLMRIADEGDILLSVRAPVGRINIANRKLIIGRGLSSVKHKKHLPNYCYYLLKNIFIKEDSFGNGSVFNSVTKSDLLGIKTIEPSFKICGKFQDLIKPHMPHSALL